MKLLITLFTFFYCFFLTNNSLLAKSVNVDDYLKYREKGFELKKENKMDEFLDHFLLMEEKFDIHNLKINIKYSNLNDDEMKFEFYYYICFESQSRIKKIVGDENFEIYHCGNAYNYFEKSGMIKDKENVDIEGYLVSRLAPAYVWLYTFDGGKENLILGEKYALKSFEYASKLKKGARNNTYMSTALYTLVNLYRNQGNNEKALEYLELDLNFNKCDSDEIIDGKNKKSKKRGCHTLKHNKAYFLEGSGKKHEARKIWMELIEDETTDTRPIDSAATRASLYMYYKLEGNYDEAEKYLYEAINFLDPEDPYHKPSYHAYLGFLYSFFRDKGYYYDAINGELELIKKIEKDSGNNSVQLLDPLVALSTTYLNIGEKKLALQYLERIVKILEKDGMYHLGHEQLYASVGSLYRYMKNYKESEKYFTKSIKILKKRNQYKDSMPIILDFVNVKILLSKYQEAENILKEAEKINSEYHENDPGYNIKIYAVYQNLYAAAEKKGESITNYDENLIKLYSSLSDHSKGLYPKSFNIPITAYKKHIIKVVSGMTAPPYEWYLKKASFFKSQTGKEVEDAIIEMVEIIRASKINKSIQNVVDRSNDSTIMQEKKKLQSLIIKYEKIPKTSDDPKEKKEIFKKLKVSKKEISDQKALILSKLNISTLSNFSEEISVKDIQQKLTDDQVIISYFFTEHFTTEQGWLFISVITKENIIFKYKQIDVKNIEELITQIRTTLKVVGGRKIPEFDFLSSQKLYNLILSPVRDTFKNKKELIIIPNKEMMSLPFEVLIDQSTDYDFSEKDYRKVSWLGKKYAISYYPSVYSFYNLKNIKFEQVENDFVGFGDPLLVAKKNKPKEINYTKLFTRGVANAEEIRNMDELPETADELKSIAKIFKGGSKLYLREDFNEETVKTIDLNNYKIISFATHAVIANEISNVAEPGLILTPPDGPTEINDGILTVSEIEKLTLQSDVVILSACNTAAADGSPNAGGLSGLASAFFQAGTKSILVTHWNVETNSAVKLTTGMFDKMKKTKNLSQALHLSKMDILSNEETSHPLFWAPFVLIGNVTQAIN